MTTIYIVLKRVYYKYVGKHRQPYIWIPLPPPHGKLKNLPTSKPAFANLVRRLLSAFGPGRYRIMRSSFGLERPGWRPVVYWIVRADGKYHIKKKYGKFDSHLEDPQAYFKESHRRLHLNMDVDKILKERRQGMLDQLRHREILKTKPRVHEIRSHSSRPWKVVVQASAPPSKRRQFT